MRGMTFVDIEARVQKAGFPGFRAKQIYQRIYRNDAREFSEMTNLPQNLTDWLDQNYRLYGVAQKKVLTAKDGSQKILFSLDDGLCTESVLMPQEERPALCLSTQVGCKLACSFCLTAKVGFKRNLTTAEIIDQLQYTRSRIYTKTINNLVFMGMGEPLLNTGALIPALRLLTAPEGIAIPTRRITVSTAGIVPGIKKLAQAKTGVNLAVSLNAPNDSLRNKIMPINKKYPLPELIKACREFPLDNRRRITFEYVLLNGINDSPRHAQELVRLVHPVRCKINLICFNEHETLPFKASPEGALETFKAILAKKGYIVAVRYSKGKEIRAACGQLAGEYLD